MKNIQHTVNCYSRDGGTVHAAAMTFEVLPEHEAEEWSDTKIMAVLHKEVKAWIHTEEGKSEYEDRCSQVTIGDFIDLYEKHAVLRDAIAVAGLKLIHHCTVSAMDDATPYSINLGK